MLGCGSGKLSLDTVKHCNQMIKLAFEKLSSTSFRWALVKDEEVAKKMVKYVELNTIGVSKDSQLRAAKVLQVATDGYKYPTSEEGSLFDFAANVMEERWKLLRAAVRQSGLFTLPEFSPGLCRFLNSSFAPRPGKYGYILDHSLLLHQLHHAWIFMKNEFYIHGLLHSFCMVEVRSTHRRLRSLSPI